MTRASADGARMRGAFVGACSGAVALPAHGLGGGAPSQSAILLLIGVCVAVGAAATTAVGARMSSLIAQLCIGQAAGHLVLMQADAGHAAMGHMDGPGLGLSPTMLLSHLAAAVVCALLIASGERFWNLASSSLRCVVALICSAPAIGRVAHIVPVRRALTLTTRHLGSGSSQRGPPDGALAAY